MRYFRAAGNFFAALVINMLFNLEWSIPAWILLGLHFWQGISLWWFAAGIGLWLLRITVGMLLVKWANRCGSSKDPPKENKNPYSSGAYKPADKE